MTNKLQERLVENSAPALGDELSAGFGEVFERLKNAVGAASDGDLGKALGVKQQTVSAAKAMKKIPPVWITRISQKYPVSADWLMFGFGRMRRGPNVVDARDVDKLALREPLAGEGLEVSDTGLIMVPKVRARLGADHGNFEADTEIKSRCAFRSDWIRRKGQVAQMVLMDVAGDSMEPFICDNDTVLIDQSQRDILTGKIYAVGIERTVVIKQIEMLPGKMVLKSLNKEYAPIEVVLKKESQNVRILGRVVWWCRDAR